MKSPDKSKEPVQQLIAYLQAFTGSTPDECSDEVRASFLMTRYVEQGGKVAADPKLGKLLGKFTARSDVIEWIRMSGSPLLSTKTKKASPFSIVPIFGYRESLFSMTSDKAAFISGKNNLSDPSKWLLGTTPEMVASSLLRAMSEGHLRQEGIDYPNDVGFVPSELLKAFNDPGVSKSLCSLLSSQDLSDSTAGCSESSLFSASSIKTTALVFFRNGLHRPLHALMESKAFAAAILDREAGLLHLFQSALQAAEPAREITSVFEFCEKFLKLGELDPAFDSALCQVANMNYHFDVGAACYEYLEDRFVQLKRIGKQDQAQSWIGTLAEKMVPKPSTDEDQKQIYRFAVEKISAKNPKLILNVLTKDPVSAALLLEALTVDDVSQAFGNALKAHIIYKDESRLLFDLPIDQLHEKGAMKSMLCVLQDVMRADYIPESMEDCRLIRRRKAEFVGNAGEFAAKALAKDYDEEQAKWWLSAMYSADQKRKMMSYLPTEPRLIETLSEDERVSVMEDRLGI